MTSVEFWFEFASTYSYPAAMRVERLAADAGIELRWRAFLLGPIFQEQGLNDSPFNLNPVKGRYMWRDLERICGHDGLPFKRSSVFPRNALLPARIACEYQEADWLPEFVRSTYIASFGDDRDITSEEVIADVLEDIGQPAVAIIEQAQSPASKLRLREQTADAQRRGIFGAPTIFAGEEMFWGNDRLEEAFAWHRNRAQAGDG